MLGAALRGREGASGMAWLMRTLRAPQLAGGCAAGVGRVELRHFGQRPRKDVGKLQNNREWPSVKEMTASITRPMKRRQWLRQPLPYIKGESKEDRKARREVYLLQRSMPVPLPQAVLHGPHTKLGQESTFRRWWLIDAKGKIAGRMAQEIIRVLMGKHKPIYDPALVMGDYVVVINVEHMGFTGWKHKKNLRRWHTGWQGGLKEQTYEQQMQERPEDLLRRYVAMSLPKNSLRRERLKLLRVFTGDKHPHVNEDIQPMPQFLKVPSPWVPQQDIVLDPHEGRHFFVYDEQGNPVPDLTDNTGRVWKFEEIEQVLKEGEVFSDEALKDAEALYKTVPDMDK